MSKNNTKKGFKTQVLLTGLLLVLLVNCAKKGTISGGKKDENPPKFVRAQPPNYSTNFKAKEIKIYFDEYIKLKEPQKQILISPPMDPAPIISPLGTASKFIKIKFIDTLLENTTYSINFGESIVDNNEENPKPFFKYVFSTGKQLDSLKLNGFVSDAYVKSTDKFVSVMLYEVDTAYTDSLVYKEVPRYVTSTLDTIDFRLENLKKGTYKLIALKDKSSNFTYQPKQDKIGFYSELITIPTDTNKLYEVKLFKEVLNFDAKRPKQISKYHFQFGYEGLADSMKIKLLSEAPENFEVKILQDQQKDTLHYWYKPFFEADSLVFEVTNSQNYRDTLVSRFKDQKPDSLVLRSVQSQILKLDEDFAIASNTPLTKINNSLITIRDKDSTVIKFTSQLDTLKNQAILQFEKTEENTYSMQVLPKAFTDFYENANDTIVYNIETTKYSEYGKMFLTVENATYPIIAQLTNEKNVVLAEKVITKKEETIFSGLEPKTYYLRIINDTNKNSIWDTGNFLKGLQPEKVSHFPKAIEVRANWELKQNFVLEKESSNP